MCTSIAAADDWIPSKWGKHDTMGAVNEITPEVIVNAAKLVKTGKRYALGQITSRETPAFGSRVFELFVVGGGVDGIGSPLGKNGFTFFDS